MTGLGMGQNKQGQEGSAPLDPPPKAEPLESIRKVFEEGAHPGVITPLPRRPLPKNLKGSKGCALSGGQGGRAPLPCLLWPTAQLPP